MLHTSLAFAVVVWSVLWYVTSPNLSAGSLKHRTVSLSKLGNCGFRAFIAQLHSRKGD